MRIARFFLLGSIVSALLLPTQALAHGERVTTRPEDGATQKKAPDHVMVNLSEAPSDRNSVSVLDGCQKNVVDEVYTQAKTLHVLLDKGQPGEWLVEYQVISKEDGHKTADAFTFDVKGKVDCSAPDKPDKPDEKDPSEADDEAAPDTGPDASGPTSSDESSLPIVPIAIGVVLLLALAFGVRMASARK